MHDVFRCYPPHHFIITLVLTLNTLCSVCFYFPSRALRKVTIPQTHLGLSLRLIGGKIVGVFVSDIKPEVTQVRENKETPTMHCDLNVHVGFLGVACCQVFPGDQVLEINGHSTREMTLLDANSLLTASAYNRDLKLTVVENRGSEFKVLRSV